ncbi:MAG: energy transducer TonB [Bacteriovoracaceae bacterium]|jgi:TonB family protein|nr:energy transducer TonB [Bacteriovoracaceae bacterium]
MRFIASLIISLFLHGLLLLSFSDKPNDASHSSNIGATRIKARIVSVKENTQKSGMKKNLKKKLLKKSNNVSDISKSKVSSGQNSKISKYLSKIRSMIVDNKYKNRLSSRLNLTGKVGLLFDVMRSGEFENLKVVSSSGKEPLDESALGTIKNIGSFPPIPDQIIVASLSVEIEIEYQ